MGGAAGAIVGGVGSALGGAGGSMKGSRGKGKQDSPAANALLEIFQNLSAEGQPLREELGTQFLDILRTGGSQAINPSIEAAREASNYAGAKALQDVEKDLHQSGQYHTPFGRSRRDLLKMETGMRSGQIAPQMQFQFMQNALPLIAGYSSGQGSTIAQGLGAAVQGTYTSKDKTNPTKNSFLGMGS